MRYCFLDGQVNISYILFTKKTHSLDSAVTQIYKFLILFCFAGIGFGLAMTPPILVLNQYFDKRRAIATAIGVSGFALGGFVMPPLVEYLVHEFNLRSAFLIISAVHLNVVVFGMCLRPKSVHALIQEKDRRNRMEIEKLSPTVNKQSSNENDDFHVLNPESSDNISKENSGKIEGDVDEETDPLNKIKEHEYTAPSKLTDNKKSILQRIWISIKLVLRTTFDPTVLRTLPMVFMGISSSLIKMSVPHALFYLHAYANSIGVSSKPITPAIAGTSLVEVTGGLVMGVLCDAKVLPPLYLYLIRLDTCLIILKKFRYKWALLIIYVLC